MGLLFYKYFRKMKTVAIITGGKTPEHDIANVSARNIYSALDTDKFHVVIIGISRKGQWFQISKEDLFAEDLEIGSKDSHYKLCLLPFDEQPIRYASDLSKTLVVDVFFPIAHGVYGEDGTLQGVLEYLDRPFVGPGVLGSSIGMDKDVSKQLLAHNSIRVTPWKTYFKGDSIDYSELEEMGYPLFVKPANMGSGVGIEKAIDLSTLKSAIELAFQYDIKILVEKGISGREIETAVLGNLKPKVTGVGEIVVESGFYTYENKYVNSATQVIIPATGLADASVKKITDTALKAYRILQLEGMSRVDFFYVNDNEFYLNEVNTLPGFTNISMYPKLWEVAGVNYKSLLSELVDAAVELYDRRNTLRRNR
jgi:D-alanine-D-alanine ligase